MRTANPSPLTPVELDFALDAIASGVSLDLTAPPPPIHLDNTFEVRRHAQLVGKRLAEYIDLGAVEQLPCSHRPSRVQPLHVIIRSDRKPRLVIDLSRNLNEYIRESSVEYEYVAHAIRRSTHGCWYGKLDLSNCFLSFPLHPSYHHLFTFRFRGRLYRFTHMPFGLSSAPRICTLLLAVVAFDLAAQGISLVRYLDDFLIIASSSVEAAGHLARAMATFGRYGLVVNPSKTEGPAQALAFLGVRLDSVAMTVSITDERRAEICQLIRDTLASTRLRARDIRSLAGKLSFAAQCLPGARPFMRSLFDSIADVPRSASVVLPDPTRDDLHFWLDHIDAWNGRQSWIRGDPIVISTDASIDGFGIVVESLPHGLDQRFDRPTLVEAIRPVAGTYDLHTHMRSHRNIGYLELRAILFALHRLSPILRDGHLSIRTDNGGDVHVINRQTTRSPALLALCRAIADLCLRLNCHVWASHRPGIDNVIADWLSRPALHAYDWTHTCPSHPHAMPYADCVCTRVLYCTSSHLWIRTELDRHFPPPAPCPIRPHSARPSNDWSSFSRRSVTVPAHDGSTAPHGRSSTTSARHSASRSTEP